MFKKIFIAAMIMVSVASIAHAEAGKHFWSPELRIGILSGVERVILKVSAPCTIIDPATGNTLGTAPANKKFAVNADKLKVEAMEIRPEKVLLKELRTTIEGKEYYGGVRINKVNGKLDVISLVQVEEYLRGVVSKEMSPSYPLEALKAQTVAARSFAMKNRKRHALDGFDLCTTTHCQIYDGVAEFESVEWAIEKTRGEVLVFKDRLIDANFHTDSGGMTASSEEVWGRGVPYLISVREHFTAGTPWTIKADAKILDIGKIKSVKVNGKTASGRVATAQIVGAKKTLTLTGRELREKFSLPSTMFNMKLDGDKIVFIGFGSGHGVGMSQRGARTYAEDAWSYDRILTHYYTDTNLKKLY